MEFRETSIFTKMIQELLNPDQYQEMQNYLIQHPKAGALIRGGYGLRKLRFQQKGRGKRGGIRTIYYYHKRGKWILLLLAYAKSVKDDLTADQIKQLAQYVKEYRYG